MGIWNIHRWNVLPEKMNEHEETVKQLRQYVQEQFPNVHVNYFRQRFGPLNGRVFVYSSFKSLAEWESFEQNSRSDPAYRKILGTLVSCLDQDSHDEFFWDEAWVEEHASVL